MADRQSEDKLSRSSPVAPPVDSAQPVITVSAAAAKTVPATMTMATSVPGHVPTSSSSVSLNNTVPSSSSSFSLVSQPSPVLAGSESCLSQSDIIEFVSNLLIDSRRSGKDDQSLVSLSARLRAIGSAAVAAKLVYALRLDIIMSYLPTLAKLTEFLNLLTSEYVLAILQTPVIQNHFAMLLQQESARVPMQSVVISFMLGLNDKDADVLPAVVSLYRAQPWHQPMTCFDIYLCAAPGTISMLISIFNIVPTWGNLIEIINGYHDSTFYFNRVFALYNIIKESIAPSKKIIKTIFSSYLSRIKDHSIKNTSTALVKILKSAISNKFIGYQDVIDLLNTVNKNNAIDIILLFPKDFMTFLLKEESAVRGDKDKRKLPCSNNAPFNLMGYIYWLESRKTSATNQILEDFFIRRKYANNGSFKLIVNQINMKIMALDVLAGLSQDVITMIFACFNEAHSHSYKYFIGYKISEHDMNYFFNNMEAILNSLTDPALLITKHLLRGNLALMQIVMSYQSISAPMLEFIRSNANHIARSENITDISRQVKELPSSYGSVHRIRELMIHLSDSRLTSLLISYFSFLQEIMLVSFYVDVPNSKIHFSEAHLDRRTHNYDGGISPYCYSWRNVPSQHKPFMLLFFMFSVLAHQDERELTSMGVAQNRASLARLVGLASQSIQNQRDLHGFLMLFPWNHWSTIVNLLHEHIDKLKAQGETFDEFLALANHEGMPARVRFLCMHLDRLINRTDEKMIAITDATAYDRIKQEIIDAVYIAKRKGKPLTPSQLCLEMLGGLSATIGTALSFFVDNPVANIRQEIIQQIRAMKCEASMFTLLDMMHYYQVRLAQLEISGSQFLERYNMYLTMELLIVYFNQELHEELVNIRSIYEQAPEKPKVSLERVLSMPEPDPVDVPAHAILMSSSSSSTGPSVNEEIPDLSSSTAPAPVNAPADTTPMSSSSSSTGPSVNEEIPDLSSSTAPDPVDVPANITPMSSSSSSMGPSINENSMPDSSLSMPLSSSSEDDEDVICSERGFFSGREDLAGLDDDDELALLSFEKRSRDALLST